MKRVFFLPFVVVATMMAGSCAPLQRKPVSPISESRPSRAIAVNAENVHAYFQLGSIALDEKRPGDAEAAFRKARELKPDFEEAWNGEGIALLDAKRFSKAASHYAAMTVALPKSPLAAEGSAAAALGLRKLDAARQFAEAALALDAKSSQGHRILGEVAYIQGDYATAIQHWQRALELNPALSVTLRPVLDDLKGFERKYGATAAK